MISNYILRVINRFLMRYGALERMKEAKDTIYLTFDDGPESGITEYILDELDAYDFKATFFCTGKNAELYPHLVDEIDRRGHCIGNHSYSHQHAYAIAPSEYVKDIHLADSILRTAYFRPPNGCLRLSAWLKLRKQFKIIYWSIVSGDWQKESFDMQKSQDRLRNTVSGDIVLFHFSKEFESRTKPLLSWYLQWLSDNGFKSSKL